MYKPFPNGWFMDYGVGLPTSLSARPGHNMSQRPAWAPISLFKSRISRPSVSMESWERSVKAWVYKLGPQNFS